MFIFTNVNKTDHPFLKKKQLKTKTLASISVIFSGKIARKLLFLFKCRLQPPPCLYDEAYKDFFQFSYGLCCNPIS